ncbi:MAG TPA: class A sortase [Candidatus Tetragenococcus pullicola]|nr:class A sortase [Candidatus Tetragenococcus pullicola]
MRPKKEKKSKWKNRLINLFLIVLLLVGLLLVFNDPIKKKVMQKNTDNYAINQVSRQEIEKNTQKEATFDFDAVEPISFEKVMQAQFGESQLPVIGAVAIPKIGINLPIFKGLSNEALLYGAGTFTPEQQMGKGNYALASHRVEGSDLLFTKIDHLQIDDTIYLTDLEKIYAYQVTVSKQIQPTQVEVVEEVEKKNLITLITCAEAAGITRWVVQGELEKETPISEATEEMKQTFALEKNTF